MGIKKTAKAAIKKLFSLTGYEITPVHSRGLSYISAADTLKQAKAKNLTIPQYLETIWGLETTSKKIITAFELKKYLATGPFSILEIGAGTGVYTNETIKILGKTNIASYQVYETNIGWSDYLEETYHVNAVDADGYQLHSTKNHTMDFIHAHGVFVYTSFITTMSYLNEICRTARINSIVAFDAFDESCFTSDTIKTSIEAKQTYFSIVPEKFIMDTFHDNGFELVRTFVTDWGTVHPKYFVFKRTRI